MPRLPPTLLRRAFNISPELRTLLPACRDISSAKNELRWIKEHIDATAPMEAKRSRLLKLCGRRGRGEPLQYVLGSQPFGFLDIKCAPGVLIPRPETEAYVCHLVGLLKNGQLLSQKATSLEQLTILDFCTGTGCIPLLLFAELKASLKSLNVRGIDISTTALELAHSNVSHNFPRHHQIDRPSRHHLSIEHADVFSDQDVQGLAHSKPDIMISNPPYIAEDVWNHGRGQLGLSVKRHEPRLALVPGKHLPPAPEGLQAEDIFYSRLLDIAETLQPKVLLLEIGDKDQARRVVEYCASHRFAAKATLEVWRDWPEVKPSHGEVRHILIPRKGDRGTLTVRVQGSGNVRSILINRAA